MSKVRFDRLEPERPRRDGRDTRWTNQLRKITRMQDELQAADLKLLKAKSATLGITRNLVELDSKRKHLEKEIEEATLNLKTMERANILAAEDNPYAAGEAPPSSEVRAPPTHYICHDRCRWQEPRTRRLMAFPSYEAYARHCQTEHEGRTPLSHGDYLKGRYRNAQWKQAMAMRYGGATNKDRQQDELLKILVEDGLFKTVTPMRETISGTLLKNQATDQQDPKRRKHSYVGCGARPCATITGEHGGEKPSQRTLGSKPEWRLPACGEPIHTLPQTCNMTNVRTCPCGQCMAKFLNMHLTSEYKAKESREAIQAKIHTDQQGLRCSSAKTQSKSAVSKRHKVLQDALKKPIITVTMNADGTLSSINMPKEKPAEALTRKPDTGATRWEPRPELFCPKLQENLHAPSAAGEASPTTAQDQHPASMEVDWYVLRCGLIEAILAEPMEGTATISIQDKMELAATAQLVLRALKLEASSEENQWRLILDTDNNTIIEQSTKLPETITVKVEAAMKQE